MKRVVVILALVLAACGDDTSTEIDAAPQGTCAGATTYCDGADLVVVACGQAPKRVVGGCSSDAGTH